MTLADLNLKHQAKLRTLKSSISQYDRNHLRQVCDWIGFDITKVKYPNRKSTYIDLLTRYYADTNFPNTLGRNMFVNKSEFKHETFYYCRRHLSDFIDTLPSGF